MPSVPVLHLGDCFEVLAQIPDATLDAIICDPPYGLSDAEPDKVAQCLAAWLAGRPFSPKGKGFMGKDWDAWVPGPEIWRECLRVLKPGGHLLACAGTRMHDLMSLAIRLGGFQIRDEIALQWAQGRGFPKSLNLGREIDMELCSLPGRHFDKNLPDDDKRLPDDHLCPEHPAGDPWRGAGTALKPSYEPIVLARKPIASTVGRTVLEHGTGGLSIDDCRVSVSDPDYAKNASGDRGHAGTRDEDETGATSLRPGGGSASTIGRWPPNMLLVHDPGCEQVGTRRVKSGTAVRRNGKGGRFFGQDSEKLAGPGEDVTYADADGYEEIPAYRCVEGCPVRAIDEQSGTLRSGASPGFVGDVAQNQSMGDMRSMIRPETIHADEGGASRFFPTFCYESKVSKQERNAGCDALPEHTGGEATSRKDGSAGLQSPRAGAGRRGGNRNNHPCLHPSSLILTEHGHIPIREVRPGVLVVAADGQLRPVVDVSMHACRDPYLFEISVTGTSERVQATGNHPFLVFRPKRNRNAITGGTTAWICAQDLRVGDYTMTPLLIPHPEPDNPDLEFWFMLGLYVADGVLQSAGHGENVYPSYSINIRDQYLVERIRAYFPKHGVYPHGSNSVQAIGFDPLIGDAFGRLAGRLSHRKCLHADVWRTSTTQRQALLDGYLAGDGHSHNSQRRAKTVSPALASQLPFLATALGYKASAYYYGPSDKPTFIEGREIKTKRPYWQMFFLADDAARVRPTRPSWIDHDGVRFCLSRIKRITPLAHEGRVVNLTVGGSPTFQTAVGMSHNTVKPVALMRWLVRLVTPQPDMVVLDPFMGSGSTGIACVAEGRGFVGIERDEHYYAIARARIEHAYGQPVEQASVGVPERPEAPGQQDLFLR